MSKSYYFYKVLTAAEVGKTGTHEIYIRFPNDFDYDAFFGNSAVVNGTVTEVNFTALDITNNNNISVSLRFVYFHSSNREKRIPSLRNLFQSDNVAEGDVVRLESNPDTGTYKIKFYKQGEIQISANSLFFSDDFFETSTNQNKKQLSGNENRQLIFYGAPGTGKSHTIKEKTRGYEVIRTTFHPDSDYSTFVGAYKPTMGDPKPVYGFNSVGNTVKVQDPTGTIISERKIEYRFIKQAFLKAYLKAWKNYTDGVVTTHSTTSATLMPSSSPKSPYVSSRIGTPSSTFKYTSLNGQQIDNPSLDLLKKIDALLFPFEGYNCLGDLHNNIEVIVTDKPTKDQLPQSKKTKYDIKSLREEFDSLNKNRTALIRQGKQDDPEFEEINHRLGYLSDMLPMIRDLYNSQNGTNLKLEELPDEILIESEETLLGLCQKATDGIKVFLFMDNINVGQHDAERLISTYIHEMFHAYYNTNNIPDEIEEPIVECSMLCFLEVISNYLSEFEDTFDYSLHAVRGKQYTSFSHYGFGAFLFENRSLDWVKMFKDGHSPIDSTSNLVHDYCDGFKMLYPISEEYEYMQKMWDILHGKTSSLTYSSYKPVFLIIEEINRGNCAQIFGDIFQLLDRGDNGFSQYPIEPDTDIQMEIDRAFKEDPEYKLTGKIDAEGIIEDYTSTDGKTLSEDIQSGHVMLLPNNLFIWATMNTSDQSLFPIDSAFKRRWDWNYIKIKDYPEKDYKIKTENKEYNWGDFLAKINTIIASITSSADKQLGYFFCKPKDGKNITADVFVSKVIFYLWNDVFKDYGFEDITLFRYKEKDSTGKETEKDLTFPDFYDKEGIKVNTARVNDFLDKVINWEKKDEENN